MAKFNIYNISTDYSALKLKITFDCPGKPEHGQIIDSKHAIYGLSRYEDPDDTDSVYFPNIKFELIGLTDEILDNIKDIEIYGYLRDNYYKDYRWMYPSPHEDIEREYIAHDSLTDYFKNQGYYILNNEFIDGDEYSFFNAFSNKLYNSHTMIVDDNIYGYDYYDINKLQPILKLELLITDKTGYIHTLTENIPIDINLDSIIKPFNSLKIFEADSKGLPVGYYDDLSLRIENNKMQDFNKIYANNIHVYFLYFDKQRFPYLKNVKDYRNIENKYYISSFIDTVGFPINLTGISLDYNYTEISISDVYQTLIDNDEDGYYDNITKVNLVLVPIFEFKVAPINKFTNQKEMEGFLYVYNNLLEKELIKSLVKSISASCDKNIISLDDPFELNITLDIDPSWDVTRYGLVNMQAYGYFENLAHSSSESKTEVLESVIVNDVAVSNDIFTKSFTIEFNDLGSYDRDEVYDYTNISDWETANVDIMVHDIFGHKYSTVIKVQNTDFIPSVNANTTSNVQDPTESVFNLIDDDSSDNGE